MGLITKKVIVKWNYNNREYYEQKGFPFSKYRDSFLVKIEDLPNNSSVKVDVECDYCGKILNPMTWKSYLNYIHDDNGKYYCQKCAKILYGNENIRKSRLKNGKSFAQWCIDNNRQDVLDRWDYELNDCKPNEILHKSNKKYYFKCPRNIHKSELKHISHFTGGQEGSIDCKQCNSFAQWGIDNIGEDFFEKYWDYEKNNELGIDPWKISHGNSTKKVWIKCQKKDYHDSYPIKPIHFINNVRCPYCNIINKVHLLDSLGTLYPDSILYWSSKNKKSPYEYSPFSIQEVYWKCPESKHKDYKRNISNSNVYKFRCPECGYSKGEEAINNYLINNDFIKINQEEFDQLVIKNKYNNNYFIPQKEFDGLIGLKDGLLSYDFYITKYNLLIEYQGIQHEKYIPGFHKSKKDFEKQLEHDRRKREYANNHNINLLEIWYYDFDRIEEILERELFKIQS